MTNGRFVHHDDNLDETTLEEASHNAEKLYFAKYGVPYKRCACPAPGEDIWCIVCFAGPRTPPNDCSWGPTSVGEKEPGAAAGLGVRAVKRGDPSCSSACSSACRSGCSVACRSGCGNYCRGGLCRDQCRASCGYVCGACETKELAGELDQGRGASRSGMVDSLS